MKAFSIERNEKLRVLMDAVARVRPALEAGAREAEETATLPRASVDALDESGLFLLKLPQALGGAENHRLPKPDDFLAGDPGIL